MKILPFAALTAFVATMIPAVAAPAFPCSGPDAAEYKTVCSDPDLVRLDREIDAAFARRLAGADPLTTLLLKRDQRWFNELIGGRNIGAFDGPDDDVRKHMLAAFEARQVTLGRFDDRVAKTASGEWANVFGTVKVDEVSGDALRVKVTLTVADAERDDRASCGASAELKRGRDGWYAGPATRTEGGDATGQDPDATTNSPFELRLRLQANTLRIVLTRSEQDSFCDTPEQVTGTYFAVGAGAGIADPMPAPAMRAMVEARTVSPSFACTSAINSDEEEICADPELAARDVEVARAYREALHRLDARSANSLREDQRAYVKENALAYDSELFPAWDKLSYYVSHTGNARDALFLRLRERLAMLANLDPARQGVGGLWVGHNAMLAIVPDKENKRVQHAFGRKWATGDYKSHCEFEADGRINGGLFRPDDSFPTLTREGATLVIDAGFPDVTRDREGNRKREQPEYCTRMDSAKARLFPVKPNAAIDVSDGRIR